MLQLHHKLWWTWLVSRGEKQNTPKKPKQLCCLSLSTPEGTRKGNTLANNHNNRKKNKNKMAIVVKFGKKKPSRGRWLFSFLYVRVISQVWYVTQKARKEKEKTSSFTRNYNRIVVCCWHWLVGNWRRRPVIPRFQPSFRTGKYEITPRTGRWLRIGSTSTSFGQSARPARHLPRA